MKKLLVVSAIAALGLNTVALAGGLPEEMPMAPAAVATSDAGIYLGIEGGYGLTHWKNIETDDAMVVTAIKSVSKDSGVVGRALLGYDINRYLALELGYSYFFNKPTSTNAAGVTSDFAKNAQAVDLMGKIKAPIVENFDLYAKIGAVYLMSHMAAQAGVDNRNNFNVAYGAGADYYITPNVIANVEWLRYNGCEKLSVKDYQPFTDAFMIGLRYKFDL